MVRNSIEEKGVIYVVENVVWNRVIFPPSQQTIDHVFSPCHTIMTSSSGNNFRVTDPLCDEFTGHGYIRD